MPKRAGRPSAAQTPAPKSDKIYGSKKNPKGSATEKKAKSIKLSDKTIDTLKEKLDTFKKSHPSKKNITLGDLKAVYRRGSGAYSSSHRPTITGGAPNSRASWSYARVNKFLKKAGGAKVKAAYVQDDDLMANGGKVFNDKELLAKYKKGESIGFTGEAHLKAKGLIPRADGTKKKSEKYMAKGGVTKGGDCYEAAAQFCMGFMPEPVEFIGEPYLIHAEVKGQGKAEGIRFGHAWVEDDENVYDYSNGRRIVMPKVVYYAIGDIQTDNPLKYQRYTFPEARAKMLKTKHYGSWDIETEYADGGLIAPNGKSSNLTAEQYKLVRTPEFKAWFGDWENDSENASKVVDENGEPLIVWQGGETKWWEKSSFVFNPQYEGKNTGVKRRPFGGVYFTSNYDVAKSFTRDSKSGFILPFFLNFRNPIKIDGEGVEIEYILGQYGQTMLGEKVKYKYENSDDNDLIIYNVYDDTTYGKLPKSDIYVTSKIFDKIKLADGTNNTFDMNNPDVRFSDGGEASQLVTCINCSWQWETADSAEFDKYVCHQCGFDNSLFYDGGVLKPTMPIDQIAEKHGVSIEYLEEQLNKGLQHEKEHTDSDEVATSIALHHLAERPDYYEELEKMKLEDGGEVTISDEDYEFWIGGDENLGKAIKQDGKIVGGIAYDEDEQQIYGIVIKNKFRKKGVAKRAIKALFDKNPDLDRVYVRAVPESKGFWKKIGTDFDNYNEDAGLWEGYVKRFEDGGDIDLFGKIDISEDNSQEYEIEDFLKQQKEESHMVMTCDSSKIYKAMICKAKCEIADKRMSETENAEELNAWNSYKNIWNDCLQDIIDNNIEMYKAGGKTCGCGCGSIYSKGGISYANGGLAYGNSHDKGGMPLKVKSTGQNIEIEGGEGVVNKRSMQSSKKVEFQGKQMTPCEAVSKINEMGGGVKFKCSDVKNIIEEDGHF
jgi:hypothetical protein